MASQAISPLGFFFGTTSTEWSMAAGRFIPQMIKEKLRITKERKNVYQRSGQTKKRRKELILPRRHLKERFDRFLRPPRRCAPLPAGEGGSEGLGGERGRAEAQKGKCRSGCMSSPSRCLCAWVTVRLGTAPLRRWGGRRRRGRRGISNTAHKEFRQGYT